MVVVDDGSNFKELFKTMCKTLNIHLHCIAKGNHQALSVERFHRYLNKAITITSNDRDTVTDFIPAAVAAAYAWNSSPIDGTDITRSIPAVGREFKFPFDFELQPSPALTQNHATEIYNYLSKTASNTAFSHEILKLLLEERHTAHRERANTGRNQAIFKEGDIVSARIQVKSDASRGKIAKFQYKAKGPYKIISVLSTGSYSVQKLGQENSPVLKFHGSDLFQLPPCLTPCKPLDTPDLRYLNNTSSPIPHPLQKALDIQLYNEHWFTDQYPPECQTHQSNNQ